MPHSRRLAMLAAVIVGTAAPTAFGANSMQPGLWQLTAQIQTPGMPKTSVSSVHCITLAQIADPVKALTDRPPTAGQNCSAASQQWDGTKLTWRIACAGSLSVDSNGVFVFDTPLHMSGMVRIVMSGSEMPQPMTMVQDIDGKRLGDCPP